VEWYFDSLNRRLVAGLRRETSQQAKEVLSLISPMIRTAGTGDEVNVYIDPKLAGKYKINLHLMERNDEERSRVASTHEEDQPTVKTASEGQADFREAMVSFVSKKTSDPNYLCTIVLQKPEDKVYCVSAYLMETYLGRYAFRANFYFRKESAKAANRCYERVTRAIRELRQDVIDDSMIQNMVPRLIRKRLSSVDGEIEPRVNKMATYLDPNNVVEPSSPDKSIASYLPTKRSITDDLIMPEG
jgi:hypothetical protein